MEEYIAFVTIGPSPSSIDHMVATTERNPANSMAPAKWMASSGVSLSPKLIIQLSANIVTENFHLGQSGMLIETQAPLLIKILESNEIDIAFLRVPRTHLTVDLLDLGMHDKRDAELSSSVSPLKYWLLSLDHPLIQRVIWQESLHGWPSFHSLPSGEGSQIYPGFWFWTLLQPRRSLCAVPHRCWADGEGETRSACMMKLRSRGLMHPFYYPCRYRLHATAAEKRYLLDTTLVVAGFAMANSCRSVSIF